MPSEAWNYLWQYGPVAGLLALVVLGFLTGQVVPGYIYKDAKNECQKLSEQNLELTRLTNINAVNAKESMAMAARLIEELKKGQG